MIKPTKVFTRLDGNPQKTLQFSVEAELSLGAKISAADPVATRAMVALMDMDAVIGGAASHYGGPAAFAEIMSALHAVVFHEAKTLAKPWYDLYNLINDAGHCENGLYALKANYQMAGLSIASLRKFRSIESNLTGHGEVHCFPEGVLLSNGPLGSAVPQAQGLAMGDALTANTRVTVVTVSDGACMEGEVKEAFAAIPGMAQAGKMAPFVMIISDNNTKLSGRIDKDSFSMQPTFQSLSALGWNVVEVAEGNNLQKCVSAIEAAFAQAKLNPKKPIAIIAKTIKGIGTKKTAESSTGAHGFPCKTATEVEAFVAEIYAGAQVPEIFKKWAADLVEREVQVKKNAMPDTGEKIQKGISSAMIRARKAGLPVVSVSSDLAGSTGVADFRKEFPDGSIDVGIAESNMVSVAAGMSAVGLIPIVDTFAQFGVTKGALPHTMASLSQTPVIAVYSHTGFQDAADGASHQALSYLAMLSSVPDVDTYCLTCSEEADQLLFQAISDFARAKENGEAPRSSIFFLGRENFPKTYVPGMIYKLGESQVLKESPAAKVTIAASGSMVPEALKAIELLAQKNIAATLINPSQMNKLCSKLASQVEKTNGHLVTVEDHQLLGGMGQMLVHALSQKGILKKSKSLGVKGKFGQSAYSALELYKQHGLDASAIRDAVLAVVG